MGGPEKPRPAPPPGVNIAGATLQPKVLPANDAAKISPDMQKLMETALSGGASMIYANGFALGMTNADAFIVLQQFGRPVAIVSVSYTLAKTLSQKFAGLVKEWETKTNAELQTTDMIDMKFKEAK